jgi:hypothetical protein
LIGAPVGVALIAGISIPAILIGLPIWSGRKLYVRFKSSTGRFKRNLIIFLGVSGSILVAPLVATLAVLIGVPLLLGYVYCVVPVSLCRSGGCGVTKNQNGGVNIFNFNEDDEEISDRQKIRQILQQHEANNKDSSILTVVNEQRNTSAVGDEVVKINKNVRTVSFENNKGLTKLKKETICDSCDSKVIDMNNSEKDGDQQVVGLSDYEIKKEIINNVSASVEATIAGTALFTLNSTHKKSDNHQTEMKLEEKEIVLESDSIVSSDITLTLSPLQSTDKIKTKDKAKVSNKKLKIDSVSMISEKSMNPSIIALAGSIK